MLGAAFARAEVRLSLADAITAAQRLRPEAQRAELEVQLVHDFAALTAVSAAYDDGMAAVLVGILAECSGAFRLA